MKPYRRKDGAWLVTWNGKQHYLNKGPSYDKVKLARLTEGQSIRTKTSKLTVEDLASKYLASIEKVQSKDTVYNSADTTCGTQISTRLPMVSIR